MFTWLLTLSVASAHAPHDGALFAAVWPGGERPVITTIYRDSGVLLTRVGDTPLDVETRFLAPQNRAVEQLVYADSDRLLTAVGEDGLWLSDDLGDTWTAHGDFVDIPDVHHLAASPAVDLDGVVLAAGTTGIWRSEDRGTSWASVLDTDHEVMAVAWGDPDTVCAIVGGSTVQCSDDGGVTWPRSATSPVVLYDLALEGATGIWATSGDGLWHAIDGAWGPAGLEGAETRYVTRLSSGTLLVVRDEEGVWRSDDDGDTWTLADTGLAESLIGVGAPRDGLFFRQLTETPEETVLLASWSGLYASSDDGLTWSNIETEMPWTTRSIDLSQGSDDLAWVLIGKYGGGPTLVRADGSDPQPVGGGMGILYSRGVALGAGPTEAQALVVTDFDSVEVSQDGGASWTSTEGETWDEIGFVDIEDTPKEWPIALLAGENLDSATFARSTNGGLDWSPTDSDADCFGGRRLVDMPPDWDLQPETWAGCRTDATLYVSDDRGGTWTGLGTPAPAWLMWVQGLPGEAAAFAATTEGLYRVGLDGSSELVAFEGRQVSSVAMSPAWAADGTGFALVAGLGWYRTTDHGASWDALDRPTLSHAECMEVSPAFATDQTLAVGTYDGTWASRDGGETWIDITGAERIEDLHDLWDFSEGWEPLYGAGPSAGRLLHATWPGLVATVQFEGVAFDLLGRTEPDGGSIAVRVDDGPELRIELWSESREDQVSLLSQADLAPGVHTLTIEVISADAGIDALVAWHTEPPWAGQVDTADTGPGTDSGGPPPGDSGEGEGRCEGCASGGTHVSGLLAILGLLAVRRRAPAQG